MLMVAVTLFSFSHYFNLFLLKSLFSHFITIKLTPK